LDLVEDREQHAARDDDSKMMVPLIQPSNNIKDEIAVGDYTAEVA
jgi:hypothetical protein